MQQLQPHIGERVRVRRRAWTITDIEDHEHCRVLTLSSPHAAGTRTWRVIHPFDDVERVRGTGAPRRVGMRAWRRACRALIAAHGDAWSLRTLATAGIELLPYQLEPALAFLLGHGSRILVSDDVGLGKTVQAMLALAELLARGVAARALVLCPAGLREQWRDECARRFGLPLAVMDQRGVRRVRAELPPGLNPWTVEPLVVASIDYAKRPEVLPAVLAARWDLVIVDEAHGACGESERRDAVSRLCSRALYVLLLTATPHSGDEASFSALCGLGGHGDRLLVFRRTRADVGRDAGRRVHTLPVQPTTAEKRMHAALARLTRAIRREAAETNREAWLVLALLHKRALSSAYSLASSAERRLQMLGQTDAASGEQLLLPLDDETGELDGADAAPMWGGPALRDTAREQRLLAAVVDAARDAQGAEAKLRRLRRLLCAVREPVIVFTEYRDTLLHVRSQVAPGASVIHGGMTREQRREALKAFPSTGILLATDAAGEGLNLQEHCRCVINLELPWNPMRLEQRIGRVDRIGQRRRAHAIHLVAAGTGELRLIQRLTMRVSQASTRLAAPNPLCGRPEWTEQESARLVVLRKPPSTPSSAPTSAGGAVPLERVESHARREVMRAALGRALNTARGSPDGASAGPSGIRAADEPMWSRAVVAWARSARSRTALTGRTLRIYVSNLLVDSGRPIATHVFGVLSRSGPLDRPSAAATPTPGNSDDPPIVGPPIADWTRESIEAHRAMTTMRLRRARAIQAHSAMITGEQQPGLFDRRTEQARDRDAAHDEDLQAWIGDVIVRAEAHLPVTEAPTQLAAVLLPRRPEPPP